MSNYETGKSQPDIDTIVRLAEALQADPNTLICGIPMPPARKREYAKTAVILAAAVILAVAALATRGLADEMCTSYQPWVRVHRQLYLLPVTWLFIGYAAIPVFLFPGAALWLFCLKKPTENKE